MKLKFLKSQLLTKPDSIGSVYFTTTTEFNAVKNQVYPYVIWDLATYKSKLSWTNLSQMKEKVPLTAYIVGYYDKRVNNPDLTIEEKWDELREAFREYIIGLNALDYINILNIDDMQCELYNQGVITPETEIGASFTVELDLYCNVSS